MTCRDANKKEIGRRIVSRWRWGAKREQKAGGFQASDGVGGSYSARGEKSVSERARGVGAAIPAGKADLGVAAPPVFMEANGPRVIPPLGDSLFHAIKILIDTIR